VTTNGNNTNNPLSSSTTVNNTIPTNDPLHGLLLGNTTAFDAITTQQQQVAATGTTSPNRFKSKGTIDKDSSLIINGKISFLN
jgi:hypothetical protein